MMKFTGTKYTIYAITNWFLRSS